MLKGLAVALGTLGLAFTLAAPANAALMLRLSDGVNPDVTITDQLAGDANATAGVVTFIGGIGAWTVNVTTGLSKPLFPASGLHMDLNSVNVTSAGGGSLTILLTDPDWATLPGPATTLVGGTTGGSVSFDTYYDAGNAAFTLTTLIASLGPFGPGAFSGTASGNIAAAAPFSVTMRAQITHTGPASTSFDYELIPEPATMLMFGLGLLGLGALSRRRQR